MSDICILSGPVRLSLRCQNRADILRNILDCRTVHQAAVPVEHDREDIGSLPVFYDGGLKIPGIHMSILVQEQGCVCKGRRKADQCRQAVHLADMEILFHEVCSDGTELTRIQIPDHACDVLRRSVIVKSACIAGCHQSPLHPDSGITRLLADGIDGIQSQEIDQDIDAVVV